MYLAYIIQPHGCDYTIACGHKLISLEATDQDAAIVELHHIVTTEYQGDIQLSDATLLHVTQAITMPVAEWYQASETAKQLQAQLEQEAADRAQYERLRARFG